MFDMINEHTIRVLSIACQNYLNNIMNGYYFLCSSYYHCMLPYCIIINNKNENLFIYNECLQYLVLFLL